jgi:hypothetical protein
MKMVKSLLLGSAAGVVALTGAQAADLPVKAKPVQYVKICSLYGAGFYYIPGTDTCLKLGGYVRAEYNYNAGGSFAPLVGPASTYDRSFQTETMRARFYFTADVRSQTEYGTLRAYGTLTQTWSSIAVNNGSAGANRAFIQFAGFTLGQATSFFDFFSFARYSNQTNVLTSDTGGGGWLVAAYTAQLGNGFSASISVEDPRIWPVFDTSSSALTTNAGFANRSANFNEWPDFVGNLRVDQSWGSAQVMGAIHRVAGLYYNGTNLPLAVNAGQAQGNGHPGDEVGWAAGVGVLVNLPMLGAGDNISAQFTYAKGATGYNFAGRTSLNTWDGASFASVWLPDAVYSSTANGELELLESWVVAAGFQHAWNPQWKTTLYGGYGKIEGPGVNNTAALCPYTTCNGNLDAAFWQVGTRTTWTPVQNLDLSVDVLYNAIETAYAGSTNTLTATAGNKGPGTYTIEDQEVWSFILRAQRNFWP